MNKKKIRSLVSMVLLLSFIISPLTSFNTKAMNLSNEKNYSNTYIGDGYAVTYSIRSQWPGGFNGDVSITNTGDQSIMNWSIMFVTDDIITNIWNARIASRDNNLYHIKNSGWNADIAPGESVNFFLVLMELLLAV